MHETTTHKKIVVLIPCRNEAAGVGGVVTGFPYERARRAGFGIEVHVIDNGSTDATAQVARAAGATVHVEPRPGKGCAMRYGFRSIPPDATYIAMIDGDGTYDPNDLLRLVEALETKSCDAVLGSRLAGSAGDGSLSFVRRVGNRFFTHLVRVAYRTDVTDVLTGYWVWNRTALVHLAPHLTAEGFGLEMEMVTKMARLGAALSSVPVRYAVRSGTSHLHPFRDGLRILQVFIRALVWHPSRYPQVRSTTAAVVQP